MNKIVGSHKHFMLSLLCIAFSAFIFKFSYEFLEEKPMYKGQVYVGKRLAK